MRRGWFVRIASQERFERAARRTADPSASLGMTRGEGWLRLELLVDERDGRSLDYAALRSELVTLLVF